MDLMEIVWSLALLVGILLAVNYMAGGRASIILRPTTRLVENLLSFAVKAVLGLAGSILRLGGGSVKLPKSKGQKDNGPSGPPPPRWKDDRID